MERTNSWSQRLSSRICGGLSVCQSIFDPALTGRDPAQARQHPRYGGVVPFTAMGRRYSSSVQLFRQRPTRNEARRHKLPNDRNQCKGAGVRGPLIG